MSIILTLLKLYEPSLNRGKCITIKLWFCDIDADRLEDFDGWDAAARGEEFHIIIDHGCSFSLVFLDESKGDEHAKRIRVAIKRCGEDMWNR